MRKQGNDGVYANTQPVSFLYRPFGGFMMCQPKKWWWGLPILALLWFLAGQFRNDPIQTDLVVRGSTSLASAGYPWAKVTIEGRDATLTGVSPTPEARTAAADSAFKTFGIRLVNDGSTVMAEAKPWLWSATREAGKITLGGFVADEAARTKLIADTRAAVPGAEIIDQMKLARGVTPTFSAASAYTLAQLARLPDGKATLSDATLTITGSAPSLDIYRAATAAGLPQGLAGSVQIGLPVVRPYLWQAQKEGATITLTGLVPSADVKARLAEGARAAAPNATVVDRLQLAGGAPSGLDGMAAAAFGHLARLTSGIASLTDAAYTINGVAGTADNFAAVTQAVRALPPGFSLARSDISAPTINPYTWSATRNGPAITLSGYVPTAAVREANVAAARTAVPNAMITDQQSLGAGAPNGFQAMTAYALGQLGQLTNGVASLSNTLFTITGAAPSPATRDQMMGTASALPTGFALARREITAPAVIPTAPPPPAPAEVTLAAPALPPLPVVPVPLLAPAPVVVTRDDCQARFNALLAESILFATNSDEIQPVSYLLLGRLGTVAKACPGKEIEIGAHTDTDGSPAYNIDLSQRRAASVREFLIRDGVAAASLKSVGYGEVKPIAPNDSAANKAKNRRVEFTVK